MLKQGHIFHVALTISLSPEMFTDKIAGDPGHIPVLFGRKMKAVNGPRAEWIGIGIKINGINAECATHCVQKTAEPGKVVFNLAEVSKSGPIAWDFTGFDIRLDSYDGHDVIVVGMMNHCHEVVLRNFYGASGNEIIGTAGDYDIAGGFFGHIFSESANMPEVVSPLIPLLRIL